MAVLLERRVLCPDFSVCAKRLAPLLLAALLCAGIARAEVLCGNLCEPSELAFQGVRHFKPEAIRAALAMDLKYQELSAPQRPLKPCLDYLSAALVSGYAHAGMPVTASAAVEKEGTRAIVRVRVTEGPLYEAGKVLVEGTKLFTAEEFQRKFAEAAPTPPQANGSRRWPASWVKGEPAPLDQLSLSEFALRAQEMFGGLGRLEMEGTISAQPGETPGTQDLRVVIRNEGTPLAIQSIEVQGAHAIPTAEIVARSRLQAGELLTTDALKGAQDALMATAQFSEGGLDYLPGDKPGVVKVLIRVREQPWARPLSEKPSDTLLTLQRSREWLNQPEKWEEDVVVEAAAPAAKGLLRICWKPAAGLIAEMDASEGNSLSAPLRGALLLRRGEAIWCSSLTKSEGRWMTPGSLGITLDIRQSETPGAIADTATFQFGLDYSSGDSAPFFKANMTPEAVYALREGWVRSPDGKLLSRKTESGAISLDTATGRIVSADLGELRLTWEKGAYDAALARAHGTEAGMRMDDLPAPIALARDVLYAALQSKEDPAPFRQALTTLTTHLSERLRPLLEESSANAPPFRICTESALTPAEGGASLFLNASGFFPARSTPWTILHDAAMVYGGKGDYRENAERLRRDPRTGPLGFLALSMTLRIVDPPLSTAVAKEGLQKCHWEAFDREVRALAEGNTSCARVIAAALSAGADLTEQEWAGFATLGGTPSQRSAIIAAGRSLRENRRALAPDALSEVLKLLWPDTIRPGLAKALNQLAAPQPSASPAK